MLGLFLIGMTAHAQNIHIRGIVMDNDSRETLPGIAILIKGTSQGIATDIDGRFNLTTEAPLPITLLVSGLGYKRQEIPIISNGQELTIKLEPSVLQTNEVVVTASRVEESIMASPVAIEKLSIRDLRESPAPGLFDALEAVKGVQMTTVSLGFKVPNTRGFTNPLNARFLSMVDGVDTQAPGLGVSIANAVGPTDLDIESIEVIPGASSALYGLNALNGTVNMITKDPFLYQGFSFQQKTGVNHINSEAFNPQLFSETALRYATRISPKLAFKINFSHLQGTDWVANSMVDINPLANASTNLLGMDNPARDPINSYGNENPNRRFLTLGDGLRYEVRRTGYRELDLVNNDYGFNNTKADLSLHYKIRPSTELIYTYRIGTTDAIFQRGNRIRLDNYRIQQHRLALKSDNFMLNAYWTSENTVDSYNMRPMGENLDRAFKSDNDWFRDYTTAFNQGLGTGISAAANHQLAREFADQGRFVPGTPAFNQKLRELAQNNNWDIGAQLIKQHDLFHVEGLYELKNLPKNLDILMGADFRSFLIRPEGNSFINPSSDNPLSSFHFSKFGGFTQVTGRLLDDRLKLIASGRVDKVDYFTPKFNPRAAMVFELTKQNFLRASVQNGFRFPNLFEGFSAVNNGGIIRYGGIPAMTQSMQLFENSYLRRSVDDFQRRVNQRINQGLSREAAIIECADLLQRNTYTYLQPEEILAFDLGYKGSLMDNRLFLDVDFYFNRYRNFIDQVEIAVPRTNTIGNESNGIDPTWFEMESNASHTRYRIWTNSKSIYQNYGYSVGATYNLIRKIVLSANYSHTTLAAVQNLDNGLEMAFNTPNHILNVSFSDRELTKKIGYSIAWKYQSAFFWNSPLAEGIVPAYQSFDAQVTHKILGNKGSLKIGATNLLNQPYIQFVGGPTIGGFYYTTIRLDGILSK